jgi:hypothetical protein
MISTLRTPFLPFAEIPFVSWVWRKSKPKIADEIHPTGDFGEIDPFPPLWYV